MIDLSSLATPRGGDENAQSAEHEIAVTEHGLQQLVADSQQVPTLLVVMSARVPQMDTFMSALRTKVDARGGAVRLATVDADTQPRVAMALQVQQLPSLLLMLLGQVQPIANALLPEEEIDNLLDQIIDVARQQGMTLPEGDAEGAAEGTAEEEKPLPPLLAEAMDLIQQGDLDGSVERFEKHLQQTPGDPEAKAGLATVRLMRRTQGVDLGAAREAAATNPGDLEAQMRAADMDMLGGHVEDAFSRLLDQLRGADPETKETVRARLLELFDMAGPTDPRVAAARKRLANLLF